MRYKIVVKDKSYMPFPKSLMGESDILLPDGISEEEIKKQISLETEKLLQRLIAVEVEEIKDSPYSGDLLGV